MHADICRFPSQHFYRGRLLTADSVVARPAPAWYTDPYFRRVRVPLSPVRGFVFVFSALSLRAGGACWGLAQPFMMCNIRGREKTGSEDKSIVNEDEAIACVWLLARLCRSFPGKRAGRLTILGGCGGGGFFFLVTLLLAYAVAAGQTRRLAGAWASSRRTRGSGTAFGSC